MEVLHAALLHFLIKHCENDHIFVCLFKKLDNVGFCPNIQEAQCLLVAPCLSTAHCSMQLVALAAAGIIFPTMLGYGGFIGPKGACILQLVRMDLGLYSDLHRRTTNRTRVRLEADRDHLKKWVSVRLFGPHQGSFVSIHTCMESPDQRGKRTLVRLKWTKQSRSEYHLRG